MIAVATLATRFAGESRERASERGEGKGEEYRKPRDRPDKRNKLSRKTRAARLHITPEKTRESQSINSPLNPKFWSSPAMAISEIAPLSIRPGVASAASDVDIGDRKEAIITETTTENAISASAD